MSRTIDAPTEDELVKAGFKTSSFRNEHGEEFRVYSNGVLTIFFGDETNNEPQPLFHDDFNIWSKGELYLLGKCLMEMNK